MVVVMVIVVAMMSALDVNILGLALGAGRSRVLVSHLRLARIGRSRSAGRSTCKERMSLQYARGELIKCLPKDKSTGKEMRLRNGTFDVLLGIIFFQTPSQEATKRCKE